MSGRSTNPITASAGEHHRPAPWRGSVVHDAAPSMLYHASHPQWPSRPPLELAPSGSQIERGRLSRTVAGRTRTEPSPFAAAASRQPSAVQPYSRQPSARSRRRCRRRSSSERAPASRAAQRRASVLVVGSARARADGACKQTACTAHSFKIRRGTSGRAKLPLGAALGALGVQSSTSHPGPGS